MSDDETVRGQDGEWSQRNSEGGTGFVGGLHVHIHGGSLGESASDVPGPGQPDPVTTDYFGSVGAPSNEPDRAALAAAARRALGAPPAYYPPGFTTDDLAADLTVAKIDVQARGFAGQGLYWDGHLYGAPVDVGEVLSASPLTVILGNPGAGKTTLAKHLALRQLDELRPAAYARLDDLGTRLEGGAFTYSLDVSLAAVTTAMGHAIRAPVDPSSLALERGQASPLIILDGLDEVATASGRDEIQRLAGLLVEHGYTVVVTSRISGYTAPWAEATHLAVMPLSDPAPNRFADRWFTLTGDDVARRRQAQAASNPNIASVLTNPLTLGFICFVANHDNVPTTEAAIFERFIDHFIRRVWHEPAHWITDSARVAAITLAATDLAWSMSRTPHGTYQQRWTDSATLAQLEDLTSAPDVPHTAYAAGLLIAHGSITPTSDRYQTVRWMHRVIHEHFTARHLARLITSHATEDYWPDLLAAMLHPSWSATLEQTGQLLSETPDLHALLDELHRQAERRDTPDHALTVALSRLAKYCTCATRRRRIARFLARGAEVDTAFQLDPEATTDAILSGEGFMPAYGGGWSLASHPASRALPLLEQLHQAGLVAPFFGWMPQLWRARVTVEPHHWWPIAVRSARATGLLATPELDNCPAETLSFMIDELIDQIADGPGVLSAHEISRLAEPILTELAKRPNLPQRLALAVAIRSYSDPESRDYARIAAQATGSLHPEDFALLGVDLEREVGWAPQGEWEQQWMPVARAAHYFASLPTDGTWQLDPPLPITDLSLPLAEAVINAAHPPSLSDTPSHVESLLWALCALTRLPSSHTIDAFLAWNEDDIVDTGSTQWERAFAWMDSSSLTVVKNSLDWDALVVEARHDIADGQRLGRAGGILAVAAEVWSTPHNVRPSDRHRIEPDDALSLWLDGLTLQLQHGSGGFSPHRWRELPEGASEESLIACAISVLNLTRLRSDPIAAAARVGVERALSGAGALAHFYEELARVVRE